MYPRCSIMMMMLVPFHSDTPNALVLVGEFIICPDYNAICVQHCAVTNLKLLAFFSFITSFVAYYWRLLLLWLHYCHYVLATRIRRWDRILHLGSLPHCVLTSYFLVVHLSLRSRFILLLLFFARLLIHRANFVQNVFLYNVISLISPIDIDKQL